MQLSIPASNLILAWPGPTFRALVVRTLEDWRLKASGAPAGVGTGAS